MSISDIYHPDRTASLDSAKDIGPTGGGVAESDAAAERELADWIRAREREQRRKQEVTRFAVADRRRRTMAAVDRAMERERRWHQRAVAARRRASSLDAQLAIFHRAYLLHPGLQTGNWA